MRNNESLIYKQLVMLAVALGQPQGTERLQIYTQRLKGLDLSEVLRSIESFVDRAKFFPQLGEIIEKINGLEIPADELANIWAREIVNTIYRCGSEKDAEEELGEKYQILVRAGGWRELSSTPNLNRETVTAQMRDLAKAYINRSRRDVQMFGGDFKLDTSPRQIGKDKGLTKLQLVKAEDI